MRWIVVALFLTAALANGGFEHSTVAFLCAAIWFALAIAAALGPAPFPSAAVLALAALTLLTLVSVLWGGVVRAAALPALYTGVVYAAEWAGTAVIAPLRSGIAVVAAAGIVGRATGLAAPSPEPGSVRMAWPVSYANGLGLVSAIGVLLCLGVRPRRPLLGAVCAVALVWTFSRSAIAAALVGGAVAAAPLLRRRLALVVALAAVVLAAVAVRPLVDAFRAPAPDPRNAWRLVSVSGHGRTLLWRTALDQGRDRPVAGGGAGTWRERAVASTSRPNLPANAHSLELETFAELGVLGLAALAGFFVAVLRRAPVHWTLVGAFVAWALVSAVDWDWQLPAVTIPALAVAGALTARGRALGPRASLGVAAVGLAVAAAATVQLVVASR